MPSIKGFSLGLLGSGGEPTSFHQSPNHYDLWSISLGPPAFILQVPQGANSTLPWPRPAPLLVLAGVFRVPARQHPSAAVRMTYLHMFAGPHGISYVHVLSLQPPERRPAPRAEAGCECTSNSRARKVSRLPPKEGKQILTNLSRCSCYLSPSIPPRPLLLSTHGALGPLRWALPSHQGRACRAPQAGSSAQRPRRCPQHPLTSLGPSGRPRPLPGVTGGCQQ